MKEAGKMKALDEQKIKWVLAALGLLVAYLPTIGTLDKQVWNITGQGHGPVMLALAVWLAWQRWGALEKISEPKEYGALVFVVFGLGALMYVLGRSQDILLLETLSMILVMCAFVVIRRGYAGLKVLWFPLFFLIFIVPLPGFVVDGITGPLKAAVSAVAEQCLYITGYPIARSGVTLTIGPYQLLVADACAGMNSIFALEAIGVFYMSVVNHSSMTRNITLAILVLPISFVSNVVRVVALVLVTYYFGDEAGQGFVHGFAGILLFMVATALLISVDTLLGVFFEKHTRGGATKVVGKDI
jgi:exosortase B